MALPHHFTLCFSRFGVALRPINTFHPHSKSDYIWVHKRIANTGQGSGRSLFCRRNPYLTHVHIYTSAQAHARTQYPKLDYLASSGCKTTARLSQDNGLYIFILLVFLKVESICIKAPPFGETPVITEELPWNASLAYPSSCREQTSPMCLWSRYFPLGDFPGPSLFWLGECVSARMVDKWNWIL